PHDAAPTHRQHGRQGSPGQVARPAHRTGRALALPPGGRGKPRPYLAGEDRGEGADRRGRSRPRQGRLMAKLFRRGDLPHLRSTRDGRDRLDLVTDAVPVGAKLIRADRIIYQPGDTAARHFHTDCHHLFYVLEGEGLLHVDEGSFRLRGGMVATVGASEVHWFENDTSSSFSFVEF